MNICVADAGLVNGKCEVVTRSINADGMIDGAAVTGEATLFPIMGWMVSATMASPISSAASKGNRR